MMMAFIGGACTGLIVGIGVGIFVCLFVIIPSREYSKKMLADLSAMEKENRDAARRVT